MTFKDYLPAFVVGGYALAGLIGWAKTKNPPKKLSVTLTVLLWALLVGTTGFWLIAATGISGTITILLVLLVIPAAVIFVGTALGRYRQRRAGGRHVEPIWPVVLFTLAALAFAVPALNVLLNGLGVLTGLDHDVDLLITGAWEGRPAPDATFDTIDGTYVLDGSSHALEGSFWLSWSELPEVGDTVPVSIAPLWPFPMLENAGAAWTFVGFGVAMATLGWVFGHLALRERKNAQAR